MAQVFNQDGLANIQVRLMIIEKLGNHDAAKAAKEDLLLMLRPDAQAAAESPVAPEDEEDDPRR